MFSQMKNGILNTTTGLTAAVKETETISNTNVSYTLTARNSFSSARNPAREMKLAEQRKWEHSKCRDLYFQMKIKKSNWNMSARLLGFGIPQTILSSSKSYRQDGVTVRNVDYDARVFTIGFNLREGAVEERRRLTKVFRR